MVLDWRALPDAEREREYSPSSCIGGDYRPYVQAYVDRSEAARRSHPPETLRYGPGERQTIDLFMPRNVAHPAVLVFFHGGYWQELSKRESAFAAPQCLSHGIAYAAVDYTLAPRPRYRRSSTNAALPSRASRTSGRWSSPAARRARIWRRWSRTSG